MMEVSYTYEMKLLYEIKNCDYRFTVKEFRIAPATQSRHMRSFAHPHQGAAGSSVPAGDHTKVQFAEGSTGVVIPSLGHCVRSRRDGEDSDRPQWLCAAPHFLIDVTGPAWVMHMDGNRGTTVLPWAPPLTWFIKFPDWRK
jgi:hypothetical protein